MYTTMNLTHLQVGIHEFAYLWGILFRPKSFLILIYYFSVRFWPLDFKNNDELGVRASFSQDIILADRKPDFAAILWHISAIPIFGGLAFDYLADFYFNSQQVYGDREHPIHN